MGYELVGNFNKAKEERKAVLDRMRTERGTSRASFRPKKEGDAPYKITLEIVELVAECLMHRWSEAQIKKLLQTRAGRRLCVSQLQKTISAAKKRLRERLELDIRDQKALSMAFYESILANEEVDTKERLRAQERIDSLLGLDAKYTAINDPVENAQRARELLSQIDATTAAKPG